MNVQDDVLFDSTLALSSANADTLLFKHASKQTEYV